MDFPDPERIDQPYWIRAKFFLNPVTNIPGRGGMMVPVGMGPGGIAWAGADQPLVKDFDHTCRSQTHLESYSIEFPKNVAIDGVPENIRFKNDAVRYSATYTIKDRVVEVNRSLQIQYKSSVCGLEENKLWRSFHKVLQKDLRSQIFYK